MDKQSHDGNRRPEFIDLLIPWRRRQVGDSWQELLAPSVITDKLDYRPGETAMITASECSVASDNWGLLKKGSAGWIQTLRTSGALSAQTLGYTAASEPAISSFHMFLRLIQWQRGHC